MPQKVWSRWYSSKLCKSMILMILLCWGKAWQELYPSILPGSWDRPCLRNRTSAVTGFQTKWPFLSRIVVIALLRTLCRAHKGDRWLLYFVSVQNALGRSLLWLKNYHSRDRWWWGTVVVSQELGKLELSTRTDRSKMSIEMMWQDRSLSSTKSSASLYKYR